jgi:COX assembly protein 1
MTDRMIIGSNPLPSNPTPLSAPQEQQVRDLYYKNVRAKCAAEIETFASCALGRTFTMIYACRDARLAMNSCMLQYQNQDELDKARQEWFALAGERKKVFIHILYLYFSSMVFFLLTKCFFPGERRTSEETGGRTQQA